MSDNDQYARCDYCGELYSPDGIISTEDEHGNFCSTECYDLHFNVMRDKDDKSKS